MKDVEDNDESAFHGDSMVCFLASYLRDSFSFRVEDLGYLRDSRF